MAESEIILNENSYVNELNKLLKKGGVIAFVTDTVWGMGCLAESEKAVKRIYDIKGRDKSKPLILMSDKKEKLLPYVSGVSKLENELMNKYFPGALTLILKKSEKTPLYCTSGKTTVGIRIPDNKFFQKLCSVIEGGVLATTSANLSNKISSKTYEETLNSIGGFVDIVFKDCGFKCKGLESTVAEAISGEVKILRQGAVIL